jgi:hypothetical protein
MAVEYIGPFETNEYKILIDGYKVPYISAKHLEIDKWELLLDDRYSLIATSDQIQNWMWWVANAMAISGGYTSFGENAEKTNMYKTKVIGLSSDEFEEIKFE